MSGSNAHKSFVLVINIFKPRLKRKTVCFSEHSYFPDLISGQPTLLDLGACYGAFSKHFLEAFPNAELVLVEANPTNFRQIAIDSPNVTLLNKAVSLAKGDISFFEDENSSQNGSALFNYFDGIRHEIEPVSFEELLDGFSTVDLVKMDIEGAEWDALLKTPGESIRKVLQLSVEFHDFIDGEKKRLTRECVRRMKGLGYKLEYKSTDYKLGSKYYDCLFYKE
jgi:FkbM family methyltransferase